MAGCAVYILAFLKEEARGKILLGPYDSIAHFTLNNCPPDDASLW